MTVIGHGGVLSYWCRRATHFRNMEIWTRATLLDTTAESTIRGTLHREHTQVKRPHTVWPMGKP
jgi:hypothetical protein